MSLKFTPKKRVELVLQKKPVDKVPFTSLNTFWLGPSVANPAMPQQRWVPQCSTERDLRNRGLCLIDIVNFLGYGSEIPNVKVKSSVYDNNGRMFIRTDYETPVGNLYELKEMGYLTIWWHKKLFSNPDDFKTLLYIIKDTNGEVYPARIYPPSEVC